MITMKRYTVKDAMKDAYFSKKMVKTIGVHENIVKYTGKTEKIR